MGAVMQVNILETIRRTIGLLALGFMVSTFHQSAFADELAIAKERTADTDLEISGMVKGLGEGESGFIAHADLLKLPTETLSLKLDFYLEPSFEVTVVFMDDVMAALPLEDAADTALMKCRDDYLSLFTASFRAEYKPFFVLQIEGRDPHDWPETLNEQYLGPYYVSVSEKLAPAYADLVDGWSKRPWGAFGMEIVNFRDEYAPIFTGAFSQLSDSAVQGRELYLNNCASCHRWEDGQFGGGTSKLAFPVLASLAVYNNDYFRDFVGNPSKYIKGVYMPAHAHYSDTHFEKLTDFLAVYFEAQ